MAIERGIQAASWAVAAQLAAQVGPGLRLAHGHPGGGQYDVLWLTDREPDTASAEGYTQVAPNRRGRIDVDHHEQSAVVGQDGLWQELADGSQSVRDLVSQVVATLRALGYDGSEPTPDAAGVAYLAQVANLAALFDVDWLAEPGWEDSSGQAGSMVRRDLYLAAGLPVPDRHGDAGIWFVVAGEDDSVAVIDLRDGSVTTPSGLTRRLDRSGLDVEQVVHDTLGPALNASVHVGPAGLGLPAVLSQLNRKERFFLLAHAAGEESGELHGESLRLTPPFREALASAAGLDEPVPEHAWASFDYHLDWLHGALQWAAGASYPGSGPFALRTVPSAADEDVALVRGSQEDVDLIVAWVGSDGTPHLILVEAKGTAYGRTPRRAASCRGSAPSSRRPTPRHTPSRCASC